MVHKRSLRHETEGLRYIFCNQRTPFFLILKKVRRVRQRCFSLYRYLGKLALRANYVL